MKGLTYIVSNDILSLNNCIVTLKKKYDSEENVSQKFRLKSIDDKRFHRRNKPSWFNVQEAQKCLHSFKSY